MFFFVAIFIVITTTIIKLEEKIVEISTKAGFSGSFYLA